MTKTKSNQYYTEYPTIILFSICYCIIHIFFKLYCIGWRLNVGTNSLCIIMYRYLCRRCCKRDISILFLFFNSRKKSHLGTLTRYKDTGVTEKHKFPSRRLVCKDSATPREIFSYLTFSSELFLGLAIAFLKFLAGF
jgi:hypothetical protein